MTRELLLDLASVFWLEGVRSTDIVEADRLLGISDQLIERAGPAPELPAGSLDLEPDVMRGPRVAGVKPKRKGEAVCAEEPTRGRVAR